MLAWCFCVFACAAIWVVIDRYWDLADLSGRICYVNTHRPLDGCWSNYKTLFPFILFLLPIPFFP